MPFTRKICHFLATSTFGSVFAYPSPKMSLEGPKESKQRAYSCESPNRPELSPNSEQNSSPKIEEEKIMEPKFYPRAMTVEQANKIFDQYQDDPDWDFWDYLAKFYKEFDREANNPSRQSNH
jgi:hypothetical protein